MKLSHLILIASISGTAIYAGGCSVEARSHRYREDRVIVEEREPAYVVVREAPPAPRIVERRPAPPAQEYVWVDGYYAWNGRQYVWESGRWAKPPRGDVVWVGPRYERDERGYRYTPGYWQPRDRAVRRP